jgi:hypothetical protein
MKPVNAGSPVASVYRITSVLNTVWRNTATVVTQSRVRPCRTNAAGPRRNSPLPIERPRTMTPGPTTPTHATPLGIGGAGNSAIAHGASPDLASGASGGAEVLIATSISG